MRQGISTSVTRPDIVRFEADVMEPRRTAGLARVDVEADVAVAHRHRALGPRIGRGAHAERGFVELALHGVVVADEGDVLELGGHQGARPKISRNSFSYRLNCGASRACT